MLAGHFMEDVEQAVGSVKLSLGNDLGRRLDLMDVC